MRTTEILATLRLDAGQFDRAMSGSNRALDDFKKKASAGAPGLGSLFGSVADSAGRMQLAVGGARLGVVALMAAVLNEGRKLKEEFDGIAAAIENVSATSEQAVRAQVALSDIALRTNQSLTNTADLYIRVAMAAEETGKSQADILKFTQNVNRALLVGRTGAQQQAAALLQLGQALSSPRGLQGDEFRSLNENAPRLVKAIADGLGVTRGQLREMSKEGKLTADVIFGGLLSQTERLNQEAARVPRTWGQATQAIKDQLMLLAKDNSLVAAFQSLGASLLSGVVDAINYIRGLPKLYFAFGNDDEIRAVMRASGRGDIRPGSSGGAIQFARPDDVRKELARIEDARREATEAMEENPLFRRFGSRPTSGGIVGLPSTAMTNPAQAALLRPERPDPSYRFTVGDAQAGDGDLQRLYEDQAKKRKALVEEAARLRQDLARELARTTQGVAAELQIQLDQWLEEIRKKIAEGVAVDPQQIAAIRAIREQAIAAQRAIEAARPALDAAADVLRVDSDGSADQAEQAQAAVRGLQAALATLDARRAELQATDAGRRNVTAIAEIDKERREILQQIEKLLERIGASFRLPGQSGEVKDDMVETANAIANAVDGAVALANAFGGVSDRTRQVLANLSLVGRGVSGVFSTLDALDKAEISRSSARGIASIAGAALPVVGGLVSLGSSLFGESAADKQRREELRANTEALKLMTERLGSLSQVAVAGRQEARVEEALSRLLGNGPLIGRLVWRPGEARRQAARDAGMTERELIDLASSVGITLNDTVHSLEQFLRALRDSGELYAADFAGVSQQLQDTLQAEGVTDALEVLQRRLVLLTDRNRGFPALADALAGLDTGTVEGRTAALDRARALFADLQAGRIGEAGLGNLSRGDARQALLDLIGSLRDTTAGAGTGGFNESRTITEVTGSRLAGLLGTANTYLRDIAENTASLRVAALPTLRPPALGALTGGVVGGAPTVVLSSGAIVLNVAVPFTAAGDPVAAMAAGQAMAQPVLDALARALVPRLNEALGQVVAEKRLVTGDPRLS